MAALGYDDVRPAPGFAFQRIAPHSATGNELAEFLDITKQAASEMVDYLERNFAHYGENAILVFLNLSQNVLLHKLVQPASNS